MEAGPKHIYKTVSMVLTINTVSVWRRDGLELASWSEDTSCKEKGETN